MVFLAVAATEEDPPALLLLLIATAAVVFVNAVKYLEVWLEINAEAGQRIKRTRMD